LVTPAGPIDFVQCPCDDLERVEEDMAGVIFDDVRRFLLSLLFVMAFGWMAAQLVPGGPQEGRQIAAAAPAATVLR
jgi:hypothetical protein